LCLYIVKKEEGGGGVREGGEEGEWGGGVGGGGGGGGGKILPYICGKMGNRKGCPYINVAFAPKQNTPPSLCQRVGHGGVCGHKLHRQQI
jgi:hypothetical protein